MSQESMMKPRIFKSILLCNIRSHYRGPQYWVLKRISHKSYYVFASSCIQAVRYIQTALRHEHHTQNVGGKTKMQAKSGCWKSQNLIFGFPQNCFHSRKKLIFSSSYLSVCLRVSAWFSPDGFQWNLILGTSWKSVEEIQIWFISVINIGHFTWTPK
jgi:hypothetical protein